METDMTKYIQRIREKHPDAVILFRRGDEFYTMIGRDADIARSRLGLPVEPLQIDADTSVKSASFPLSELDYKLPKLIRAGFRVAVCELPNV